MERVHTPVSTAELERRWAALRGAMEEKGLDVLVAHSDNDYLGGYARYLTDVPAVAGYATTVIFPRAAPMTVVAHGAHRAEREVPPEGDGVLRGVERVLTTSAFASVGYTDEYDAEAAARALAPYGRPGLVGSGRMPAAFVRRLERDLAGGRLTDASEFVDRIKAVKSPEEQDLIRQTAAIQDVAIEAALAVVEPGLRESDVVEVAHRACLERGSEQVLFMAASSPAGQPVGLGYRHTMNRVLREGDVFLLMVETSGPGGYYSQIGRTCVLGEVPARMQAEVEFAVEAQRHCLQLMTPGAQAAEVWDAYNAFLRGHGRPEEKRLHCHGQGYDLVERPLVRFDETMTIEAGMNIACHPGWMADDSLAWICDGFLIGAEGAERLHASPQTVASA